MASPSPRRNSAGSGKKGGASGGTDVFVSYQASRLEHRISDEQLNTLSELRKDNVVELFWGALGGFLGALPGSIEDIEKIGNQANPMGALDLVGMVICAVFACLTVVMGIAWRLRAASTGNIVDEIRGRPRELVGTVVPTSGSTRPSTPSSQLPQGTAGGTPTSFGESS